MSLPEKITKEVKEWLKNKTIQTVKTVRPTKKEREMYEDKLNPMALKICFTDGTEVVLDSWVSEYKLKPHSITGVQNLRHRSYLTVSRKE